MITVLSVTQVFQNHTHTQLTHKYSFLKINPKTSLILERYSATKLYPSPLSLLYVFFKIYCQELLHVLETLKNIPTKKANSFFLKK